MSTPSLSPSSLVVKKAKGLESRTGVHGIAFVTYAAGLKSTRCLSYSPLEEDTFIGKEFDENVFRRETFEPWRPLRIRIMKND